MHQIASTCQTINFSCKILLDPKWRKGWAKGVAWRMKIWLCEPKTQKYYMIWYIYSFIEIYYQYIIHFIHIITWRALGSLAPLLQPQQRIENRGDETNRRTRAKPQWIVGQAYSHTYSTLSQLSRLQTICLGDSSKFRFTDKSFSIMHRDLHPHYLNHGAERLFLCMYHRPKRCFPAWILT